MQQDPSPALGVMVTVVVVMMAMMDVEAKKR